MKGAIPSPSTWSTLLFHVLPLGKLLFKKKHIPLFLGFRVKKCYWVVFFNQLRINVIKMRNPWIRCGPGKSSSFLKVCPTTTVNVLQLNILWRKVFFLLNLQTQNVPTFIFWFMNCKINPVNIIGTYF